MRRENSTTGFDEPNAIANRGLTLTLPVIQADDAPSGKLTEAEIKQAFQGTGKTYWRSLEELANSKEFDEYVHREYPSQVEVLVDPVSRRSFLKLMGASMGLAGLAACTTQPKEEVIPYVKQPEEIVPGKALYFATAMPMMGSGLGLLVRSNEGRPTKVEGNPDHPASLGSTDIWSQAAILGLYDPDRSQSIMHLGDIKSWGDFSTAMTYVATGYAATKGQGLAFLTESITSPSLSAMIKEISANLPSAKWHQYEPATRSSSLAASQEAFGGKSASTLYKFENADRVVSLDSDFLMGGPTSVRYARDFAKKRKVTKANPEMSRFYAIETTPTSTGANADNRIALRPSEYEAFVGALASAVGAGGTASVLNQKQAQFVAALAKDLLSNKGKSIIIAGEWQTPFVHAMAHRMNVALGNVGTTVFHSESPEMAPTDDMASLADLVRDMDAGKVSTLIVLGANPVYSAPGDLHFLDALKKVPSVIHHGLYYDETAMHAHWHVPEAHFLESWGDVRAHDGTVSLIQPLIAPLYQGKTAQEVLAPFTKANGQTGYEIVKNYWTGGAKGGDAEKAWRKALNDGTIGNSQSASITGSSPMASTIKPLLTSADGFDIVFRPDPTVFDGRFANNGWLQELPKPISKLTWDNAAYISERSALALGVASPVEMKGGNYEGGLIRIKVNRGKITMPVFVLPGQPDNTLTVHLGYGRTQAGRVGNGLGFDVNQIRSSGSPWFATGAKVSKASGSYPLAGTQIHFTMEGREIVRSASLEEYKQHPDFVHESEREPSKENSLFGSWEYKGYAWGMAIDLNSCVGCNACIVACVAENNIPVVGKEQVLRSREMHWIRVDRYYTGASDDPDTYFQPIPCQQCENAPCELVCPVEATSHSAEGLNDMTYNRCVGTRYCGNNCPYHVRRFNFLLFQDWNTPSLKLARNPEVTVRSRGVMEKCTYCVQRIQNAKIESEKADRKVLDGEIVTACQGACPANAIAFGDINDPNSEVSKWKAEPRNYGLLAELNTRPRTTYLGAVRNPNPEIVRPNAKENA